ncbi:type II secretion system F family protein [Facilibium subflavum]|uniref:type II secretion system F family protein n=1 Tax=Facilibium subflavum TaxID=2219058 RepID=UPI000E648D9E|nr:type II secretion system F family protein [Facilibium subflavum]
MKQPLALKKKIFLWQGTDKLGIHQQGVIKSINIETARLQLEHEGVHIKKIKKKPLDLFAARIKNADITLFSRQLATMIKAGLPITRALDTIISSISNKNLTFKLLILDIKESLETGNTISDTFKKHPKYFDTLFCGLCEAGEQSGTLDTMLDRIATNREMLQSIRKKVKKALTYPMMVIFVSIIVTWVLLNFAIPAFADIFASSGTPLPMITQITVRASEITQQYWWIALIIIVLAIIMLRYAKKRYLKVQIFLDLLLLKIPVIGTVIEKSALARFARTLETTSSAGMPLVDALKAVAAATGNAKFELATLNIRNDVSKGYTLLQSAAGTGVFPALMLQMVAVGEESGHLEEMLSNVAKIYEEDVDMLVASLSSSLEPIIMMVLGGIVGFLVISMYVPMFNLGNAF